MGPLCRSLHCIQNPYVPPPEVMKALGNLEFPYIYPNPESWHLSGALAEDSGNDASYLIAGCGTDELRHN